MKPYKKSKVARTTTHRKEYKIEANGYRDLYWDEGISYYPIYRRGFKNKTKRLMSYKIRMYKTWKHNRKTQWKN
jgi:hypothetical protein